MDMRLNLEGLEKERDFYFSKLRDIEILCQEADESESSAIITKILDILYATEVSAGEHRNSWGMFVNDVMILGEGVRPA